MNYQVLRGAIFAFVDELEERVLGVGTAISEGVSRLIETASSTGLLLVEAVIEEGFNLFRAGLAVVLGTPNEEEDLLATRLGIDGSFEFDPVDIDEVLKVAKEAEKKEGN